MAGLYIHIPFCARRCAYCDFYSTVTATRADDLVEALVREMSARRDFFVAPKLGRNADSDFFVAPKLDTIYIGGGTPSQLPPERLQGLLDHAAGLWDCSDLREVTVEANPEDLTDDYIARLARGAFNRLSIGIQSFDDGLLRLMDRRHSAERARQAVRAAQSAGFDNISIDLIYGIPGMSDAQWERTLNEAMALGVQHVSAYHLTIEPGTPFGRAGLQPVKEAESERQFETLRRKLSDAGFEHYEISNFALPGRRAIHNSAYWSGEPYLGIGPSAHSFDGARRREWVTADLEKYIAGVETGAEAGAGTEARAETIYDGETPSDRELRNERIMTSLRTSDGISRAELHTDLRTDDLVERFLGEGLLAERGGRVAIPAEKFLLSDYIIGRLFEPPD
ncbi:MAG: radical SAM family heme chaperone HemW [Alistipes sp.]|jgi:oxygen-independent coproporphyrinogen-3 oxidase|nr:radical SAM family heme chaperone HemW [Alistipes sp.]